MTLVEVTDKNYKMALELKGGCLVMLGIQVVGNYELDKPFNKKIYQDAEGEVVAVNMVETQVFTSLDEAQHLQNAVTKALWKYNRYNN